MGLTKLDRANIAKVQSITGIPNSSTRGNIAVSSTGPALYYQYNGSWYSAASSAGIFETHIGTLSARRVGTAATISGTQSFGYCNLGTISGDYSATFGSSQNIGANYCFTAGANHTIYSGSDYSAAFGTSHTFVSSFYCFAAGYSHSIGASSSCNSAFGRDMTISDSSNYNIAAGYNNTVNGHYNAYFGYNNNAISSDCSYNLVAGSNNDTDSTSYSIVGGYNNTVGANYTLTYGSLNTNAKTYATVSGKYVNAIWEGARHFSGGRVDGSTTGSSQGMDGLVLIGQTVGAATVTLTLNSNDGSGTNPLYCPDGYTIIAAVRLMGISSGTSTGFELYDFNLLLERHDPSSFNVTGTDFGGVLTSGSPTTPIYTHGSNIGTLGISEDAVNYKAELQVTGVAGITTNWVAHIYKAIIVKGSYHYGGS